MHRARFTWQRFIIIAPLSPLDLDALLVPPAVLRRRVGVLQGEHRDERQFDIRTELEHVLLGFDALDLRLGAVEQLQLPFFENFGRDPDAENARIRLARMK